MKPLALAFLCAPVFAHAQLAFPVQPEAGGDRLLLWQIIDRQPLAEHCAENDDACVKEQRVKLLLEVLAPTVAAIEVGKTTRRELDGTLFAGVYPNN